MNLAEVRLPAVAGRFYPADPARLAADVAGYLGTPTPAPRLELVAPHAGYMYSGGVAGKTFRQARIPRQVVILAPNHTGRGVRVSVLATRALRIPGADVPLDEDLRERVLREVPGAELDVAAHEREHAAEVEVPCGGATFSRIDFGTDTRLMPSAVLRLTYTFSLRPDLTILPIILGGLDGDETVAVGRGLARALDGLDVLVVASSDMSHYLPDDVARQQDKVALTPLLALDPEGLYRTVHEGDISMCGILPATAMLAVICRVRRSSYQPLCLKMSRKKPPNPRSKPSPRTVFIKDNRKNTADSPAQTSASAPGKPW